ncbi:MAG TPA: outer membrane protein assembly factor BamD [Myxococcota bacterium]|nr:outer membrane protein assembly factor BamD [Myxococcota bacterium]
MRLARVASLVLLVLAALSVQACKDKKPLFEEVPPAEELYSMGEKELQGKKILPFYTRVDYARAIEIFQAIIDNYPYSEYALKAELKIADAYYEDGKYDEALSYYRDFGDLHPQHPMVPYTIYQSGMCHYERIESVQRDQTATRNALGFFDRLLVQYPHSEYAKEAEPLWRELQIRLAEHQERIADFYRGRGEFEAAAERYRLLLDANPGLGLDARVLLKLGQSYDALDRVDEADRIFRTLVSHYANTPEAYEARKLLATNLP